MFIRIEKNPRRSLVIDLAPLVVLRVGRIEEWAGYGIRILVGEIPKKKLGDSLRIWAINFIWLWTGYRFIRLRFGANGTFSC